MAKLIAMFERSFSQVVADRPMTVAVAADAEGFVPGTNILFATHKMHIHPLDSG